MVAEGPGEGEMGTRSATVPVYPDEETGGTALGDDSYVKRSRGARSGPVGGRKGTQTEVRQENILRRVCVPL